MKGEESESGKLLCNRRVALENIVRARLKEMESLLRKSRHGGKSRMDRWYKLWDSDKQNCAGIVRLGAPSRLWLVYIQQVGMHDGGDGRASAARALRCWSV